MEDRALASFDLQRYLGLWFEIGRLPLRWEDPDASEVTAHYSLNDDGSVQVDNRCLDGEGAPSRAVGRATVDDSAPGRLKVSFAPSPVNRLPLTQAGYWVLKLDEDYRYALVGTPRRRHLWLLARDSEVPNDVHREYLAEAEARGYELTEWITPVQTGTRVTDEDLGLHP
ncbi:lipocalin family protein [Propioniciclava coleopterorum]|uniref:Lipocalin family protein n=1 Tax=Propioniciclava coleopterorum TaxID=2714937 RepID=A0A6G7Y4F3_9ACTN|nr:lipocalin family protein [Propioniciclava coleopterorum]QIK71589.1 lipocalin family protein [Propioniciclava coleopterorum]